MICLKPSSWLASQKVDKNVQLHGRSPYGERGLKSAVRVEQPAVRGRSPYGERGLKSLSIPPFAALSRSLSLRRAWIEMYGIGSVNMFPAMVALLTESVD